MIARGIAAAVFGGLVARGVTVLIPVMVAHTYTLGVATDAFFLAAAGILFWGTTMGLLLEASIVSRILKCAAAERWALVFHSGVLLSGFTLLLGAVLVASLWAFPWGEENVALVARTRLLFVELSPLLILSIWISLFSGWLNADRRFATVAASPALLGIFVLGAMWLLHDRFGVHALAIGYLLGELARLAFLGASLLRRHPLAGFSWRGTPAAPYFRNIGLQWGGLALMNGNPLVDRVMAGGLTEGSVSTFELIERIYLIPVGVLGWAVLSVMTTAWSLAQGEVARQWQSIRRSVGVALLGGAAIALFLGLVHQPLLVWLYASPGVETWSQEGERAFLFLVWGLPFQLATLMLWRAAMLNAQLNARMGWHILAIGGFAFALNALGDFILRDIWGLAGIAVVTGFTFLCTFLLLFRSVRPS
ncbi:MAG: hypothetical protein COA65_08010 [Rhodospirillaceae bacterium]|nr:MAG: hypothetical protein COA65_08010 [Rhodospirillaceae bacterium]